MGKKQMPGLDRGQGNPRRGSMFAVLVAVLGLLVLCAFPACDAGPLSPS